MKISLATLDDLDGITALHRRYHTDYIRDEERTDGFVTTNFTMEQLEALIARERGVTLAKDGRGAVVAYAMAAPWRFWAEWPLFTHMIERLPEYSLAGRALTVENSYQYGPVCLDSSVRGTGVFEAVFFASLSSMKESYPIMATFINKTNGRSYAAHTRKAKMTGAGEFKFNGNEYYLMACHTDAGR